MGIFAKTSREWEFRIYTGGRWKILEKGVTVIELFFDIFWRAKFNNKEDVRGFREFHGVSGIFNKFSSGACEFSISFSSSFLYFWFICPQGFFK